MKKLTLILLFLYGIMNQVSARFIPASVYEASYRYSFVTAEKSIFSHFIALSHVKESHDMEYDEDIEIFTDKNHAGKTFIENTPTFAHLKTSYYVLTKGMDNWNFQSGLIRLIIFPFHNFF